MVGARLGREQGMLSMGCAAMQRRCKVGCRRVDWVVTLGGPLLRVQLRSPLTVWRRAVRLACLCISGKRRANAFGFRPFPLLRPPCSVVVQPSSCARIHSTGPATCVPTAPRPGQSCYRHCAERAGHMPAARTCCEASQLHAMAVAHPPPPTHTCLSAEPLKLRACGPTDSRV